MTDAAERLAGPSETTTDERARGWTWRAVAAGSAVAAAAIQMSVGDREALAAGVGLLVATGLLWVRRGWLGRVLLLCLFANLTIWMAPAAWSNARHGGTFGAVALPAALVTLAILGSFAAIAGFRERGPTPDARRSVLVAVGVCAAVVGVAMVTGEDEVAVQPGDLVVTARDLVFDDEDLTARAGPTGIVLRNDDLFWHTFTIEELDLDLRVPVRGTRRVEADLPAGTYTFICAIPGHEAAGMVGTLVVG